MRGAVLAAIVIGCLGVGAHAHGATEPALIVAYGGGVHAYFDGDFQRTYDAMSGVIEAGSEDPRVFYFRGLAALKLGRLDEAEADFQQGANLEAEGRGGRSTHQISVALERVQGSDRLKLEEYRGRARVAALQRFREEGRRRWSDIEDLDSEVLRRRRPERIEPAEAVAKPMPKDSTEEAPEAPATNDGDKPQAEKPETDQPRAKPADSANPFADEPAEK